MADLEGFVQGDSTYELLYVKYLNSGAIIDVFNQPLKQDTWARGPLNKDSSTYESDADLALVKGLGVTS